MYLSVLQKYILINSDMYLREVYSNPNPQPSNFTSSPVYKTLRHLPFFKDAYDATKAEFEKLNDKSVSFVSMFDINLKKAFNDFVDKGGKLNASKMYEMKLTKKIVEALAMKRYELPNFIAKELAKGMEKDSALIDELMKFIPFEAITDPKTGRVVVYPEEFLSKQGLQPQLFVGDPGKSPRPKGIGQSSSKPKATTSSQPKLPGFEESNNWDNPTNAELDAERQEVERMLDLQRAEQEYQQSLTQQSYEAKRIADRLYTVFYKKFSTKHGPDKAQRMMHGILNRDPDYFIKKANQQIQDR